MTQQAMSRDITSQIHGQQHLQGVLVSLAFWTALLMASALFAALVLAPKYETWIKLTDRHAANASEYQLLQAETSRLESMAFALENDPAYARRLAIKDLDLKPERILEVNETPVNPLSGQEVPVERDTPSRERRQILTVVHLFAVPGKIRTWGIWGAAGLCLLAFVCLNDGFFERGPGRLLADLWNAWVVRYQQSEQ